MKSFKIAVFFLLILVWVLHRGTLPPPINIEGIEGQEPAQSRWISKDEGGLNHLILEGGSPYGRGRESGQRTEGLLYRQEMELHDRLKEIFPGVWVAKLISLFSMVWFQGLERYIDPAMLEEMYGVSQYADGRFSDFADNYTRQLGYHALHEVGQYFVDHGPGTYGCTVFLIPNGKGWVLGRNFDFEGGRIFDDEKVVKWVFPKDGYAFVSVIWAGMVGAVTGVNSQGLYISINASGSRDFRRLGTPTTLLVTRILQSAKSVDEAAQILRDAQTFISDIFVVVDRNGKAARIEKSPLHTEVLPVLGSSVVTNHMASAHWKDDETNRFRQDGLTSKRREERGLQLLRQHQSDFLDPRRTEDLLVHFLRDRSDTQGELPLGHRGSIDSLVATHSVLYNSLDDVFFVNTGPGSHGRYIGFDLKASFSQKLPVVTREIDIPTDVDQKVYVRVRKSEGLFKKASQLADKGRCQEAESELSLVEEADRLHYGFFKARGDIDFCLGNGDRARMLWKQALAGRPAYREEVKTLERLIADDLEKSH